MKPHLKHPVGNEIQKHIFEKEGKNNTKISNCPTKKIKRKKGKRGNYMSRPDTDS